MVEAVPASALELRHEGHDDALFGLHLQLGEENLFPGEENMFGHLLSLISGATFRRRRRKCDS